MKPTYSDAGKLAWYPDIACPVCGGDVNSWDKRCSRALGYVRLRNGVPDMAACDSLENGVILLYNRICAKANAELDILLEESEIDRILRSEDQDAAPEVIALAEREAQEFINDLLSGLRERMLELKSGKVIFLGGGATLLRRQIEASGKIGQAIFVEDINANAKGYEYLYRLQHSGR
jgi:plasmid segregation protein ParM